LRAAGVAYEVVPGVSSALAAPGAAEIPVTHRGLASAFVVVSGHAEAAYRPILDGIAANAMNVVVVMGLAQRAARAATVLARGRGWDAPAAIALAARHADAETWIGTLAELGAATIDAGDRAGTLIIGDVVSLAAVPAVLAEVGHG